MTTTALPARRTLLAAVARRDADWDGLFCFAVTTTGITCRPSCPSRPARPEHLRFFASLDEAVAAGFRPCKRCRPDAAATTPPWWEEALRFARTARGRVTDAELRAAGFEPVRLRRHAHRLLGITFQEVVRRERVATAQRALAAGASVDAVILDSAWESHSGFRDAFTRAVGAAPGQARDGQPIHLDVAESPIGRLVIAATDEGVCFLEFGEPSRVAAQAARLRRWFGGPIVPGAHPHLATLRRELDEYFAGSRRAFTVPLAVRGTPFERRTWDALRAIPHGETRSYVDIARAIGSPEAVRAVGSANGRNRIAIVVPCHRVVNADGRLGGYGGGLWRKERLLDLEGVRRRA
jgi:AraC family transcriptional regulator, regulatory protein of adaptative response / methylated-DNA-[protein]-cysteine methyltransferase